MEQLEWWRTAAGVLHNFPLFVLSTENGGQHAAVYCRQPCLFPIPEPGRASLHNAPHRHHPLCVWQQLVANFQRGELTTLIPGNVQTFKCVLNVFIYVHAHITCQTGTHLLTQYGKKKQNTNTHTMTTSIKSIKQ